MDRNSAQTERNPLIARSSDEEGARKKLSLVKEAETLPSEKLISTASAYARLQNLVKTPEDISVTSQCVVDCGSSSFKVTQCRRARRADANFHSGGSKNRSLSLAPVNCVPAPGAGQGGGGGGLGSTRFLAGFFPR